MQVVGGMGDCLSHANDQLTKQSDRAMARLMIRR
jgi:hypothetical protein